MAERRSPLYAKEVERGAKFAPFAGWLLPMEYAGGGVLAEHKTVRENVGVFDVSHLGTLHLTGEQAVTLANSCLTNDLGKLTPGQAQYSMMCFDDGGVVDDMLVYYVSDDDILLVPNAANNETVIDRIVMRAAEIGSSVRIDDEQLSRALIAVQGPASALVLNAVGLVHDMDYMAFTSCDYRGERVVVCRTGYTGERGFELIVPNKVAPQLWDALFEAGEDFGIKPAGLGARDTLRTEMGYPLCGNDIGPTIDPITAGMSWSIGWEKSERFYGELALRSIKESGPTFRLRGIKSNGRGIPRAGMKVFDLQGVHVGHVTSGTHSPTIRCGIGLALVDADIAIEDQVDIEIRGRMERFSVVKPPFVQSHVR